MCGLAGVMKYNMAPSYYARFRDLMIMAQLRGDDGSGIISVPKGNKDDEEIPNVNITRTTWSSAHLVTLKNFDDVTKGDRSCLLGHARMPTKGGNDIENVHPHRSHDICLMHNGTMSHVGGTHIAQGKSDSKEIAKFLVSHTPQEFVQNSFGAYCLTWVDIKKQTINFLRNNDRPLWFAEEKFSSAETSSTDALFWASELWMLKITLSRSFGYNENRFKFYQLPVDEHWEFPLNVPVFLEAPKKTECKKIIKHTPRATYYSMYGEYGYGAYDAWDHDDQEPTGTSVVPFEKKADQSTSANSSAGTKSAVIIRPDKSPPFRYVPPEYRGGQDTDLNGLSVQSILDQSKRMALANAAMNDKKKEEPAQSAVFQTRNIRELAVTDWKTVRGLVVARPCVWCTTRPPISEGKPTAVFPVRFADDRRDYVCEDCIEDPDIQRAFGFG
jgi:hypothetical protein